MRRSLAEETGPPPKRTTFASNSTNLLVGLVGGGYKTRPTFIQPTHVLERPFVVEKQPPKKDTRRKPQQAFHPPPQLPKAPAPVLEKSLPRTLPPNTLGIFPGMKHEKKGDKTVESGSDSSSIREVSPQLHVSPSRERAPEDITVDQLSIPSEVLPVENIVKSTRNDAMTKLRAAITTTKSGPLKSQVKTAVKEGKFSTDLLIDFAGISLGQLKELIRGIDVDTISKVLDGQIPPQEEKARQGLISLATALSITRISVIEKKNTMNLDNLDPISVMHLKEMRANKQEFFICVDDVLIVDPIEIGIICGTLFSKTKPRYFVLVYLKHVLRHLFRPSNYKNVYVAHNHRKRADGFTLPDHVKTSMRECSRRLFNVHSMDDDTETVNESRLQGRLKHDFVFGEVLSEAAEAMRAGAVKRTSWFEKCVRDFEGNMINIEPSDNYYHLLSKRAESLHRAMEREQMELNANEGDSIQASAENEIDPE